MLDIVGKRGWYFLFSAVIIIAGIISMLMPPGWVTLEPGLRPGIDFTSGSVFNVTFSQDVEQQDILQRMDDLGHPEALVQQVGINNYFVRTEVLGEAIAGGLSEREIIERDLEETLGLERNRVEFESVSPIVASETVNIAFYALAAASVFILLYVWYAFRRVPKAYRYGVSAVLALAHDVLIILGVFSILGRVIGFEVNSMFIVGLLIVAGYSVNDTIVVFDRIRENVSRHPDRDLGGLVNISIMETMARSLNTSITTLIVLIAMLLIGGPSIRELLLVLAIGAVAGTYSSIFIASQFLVMWDRGEIRTLGRARQAAAGAASSLLSLLGR